MNRDEPAKRKRSGAKGRIITVELVAFAFLAIYLIGYTVSMLKKPKIGIETVAYGQIDVPRQFDGLILRNEKATFASEAGAVVFSYGENEYVKKGSIVCVIRDKNGLEALEREIESLNDSILSRQSQINEQPAQTEEIGRINFKMKTEVSDALPLFMAGDSAVVYGFKNRLQKDIETRNGILLEASGEALSEAVDKKTAFEMQLIEGTGTYSASQGGVLSLSIDGLESELTPENLMNITEEQIASSEAAVPADAGVEAVEGSPLFKIVGSNTWYLCAFLDNELVLDWNEGTSRFIYFREAGEPRRISMRIAEIEPRGNKTYVVFSSSRYMLDYINKRHVKFSLEDDTYKGLKIPNSAITEKTALLVPEEYIYEVWGSRGVYIKENDGFSFKAANVLSQRDGKTYILQNIDGVRLGTEVFLCRDGQIEETGSFVIDEIKTTPGIYVANSGTAEFRQIDIVKHNEYYSIIEEGTGAGVKSFDSIVSDASVVSDNQIIR